MNDLINKIDLRLITLIDHLYLNATNENQYYYSLSQLEKELNVSNKTLRSDINHINEYNPSVNIEVKGNLVKLHMDNEVSINQVTLDYIINSPTIKIMQMVFFNNTYDTSELADLLFMSSSSIYRYIDNINEYFNRHDMDVNLTTNPCQFIGNENLIRLYFAFFFQYIPIDELFKKKNIHSLEKILIYYKNDISTTENLSYSELYNILISILINYTRYQQGFIKESVEISSSNYNLILNSPTLLSSLKSLDNLSINKESIGQLFTPYFDQDTIFFVNQMTFDNFTDPRYEESLRILKHCRAAIDSICEKFSLSVSNLDILLIALHNKYILYKDLPTLHFAFDAAFYLKELLKYNNKTIYDAIVEEMDQLTLQLLGQESTEMSFILLNTLLYNWENLIIVISRFNIPIKTLIINHHSLFYPNLLKDILEFEESSQLDITIWNQPTLKVENIPLQGYDLIISSINIPDHLHDNVVYSSNIINPTTRSLIIETTYQIRFNRVVRHMEEYEKNYTASQKSLLE